MYCARAVISFLIEKGANIEAENKDGFTPLHSAAGHGHVGAILALLDKGADVAAVNVNGYTPLHSAAGEGHTDGAPLFFLLARLVVSA